MDALARAFRTSTIDLIQVHNLVDVATHLPHACRLEGRRDDPLRRHHALHASAHAEVERFVRNERLDFLQINYSAVEPEAGRRLLPLAAERGVAVIANRPFGGGGRPAARVGPAAAAVGWGDRLRVLGASCCSSGSSPTRR